MATESKCPVLGGPDHHTAGTAANQHWWPNQLNLKVLHQNPPAGDPMGEEFNYAEELAKLDVDALKSDMFELMTDVAGLVAGRLWSLWAALHSPGVARGGDVPHPRWPRRRRRRHDPLRAAQ